VIDVPMNVQNYGSNWTQFRTSAGYLHFPGSDIRSRRRALDKARSSCLVTNGGPLPDDPRTVAAEELIEIVHAYLT